MFIIHILATAEALFGDADDISSEEEGPNKEELRRSDEEVEQEESDRDKGRSDDEDQRGSPRQDEVLADTFMFF